MSGLTKMNVVSSSSAATVKMTGAVPFVAGDCSDSDSSVADEEGDQTLEFEEPNSKHYQNTDNNTVTVKGKTNNSPLSSSSPTISTIQTQTLYQSDQRDIVGPSHKKAMKTNTHTLDNDGIISNSKHSESFSNGENSKVISNTALSLDTASVMKNDNDNYATSNGSDVNNTDTTATSSCVSIPQQLQGNANVIVDNESSSREIVNHVNSQQVSLRIK